MNVGSLICKHGVRWIIRLKWTKKEEWNIRKQYFVQEVRDCANVNEFFQRPSKKKINKYAWFCVPVDGNEKLIDTMTYLLGAPINRSEDYDR